MKTKTEREASCRQCEEIDLHTNLCFFNRSLNGSVRTKVLDSDRVQRQGESRTNTELRDGIIEKALSKVRQRAAPPDQHVAPPRIWILTRWPMWHRPDETSKVDDGKHGDRVDYLAAASIIEALENCKDIGDYEDVVMVRKSDWDALVESVKGEK